MAAPLKTQENDASVADFLNSISHPRRAEDAKVVVKMMERLTGTAPHMWGDSIIGFDHYDYVQSNGKPARWPIVGVSPRKLALTIYIMAGFGGAADILAKLGPHKTGASCLYIADLRKIDPAVLEQLIAGSIAFMRAKYPRY